MLKLDLFRLAYSERSTPGKLSVDGVYECVTLELPNLDNAPDVSCIPEGLYRVEINFSKHHKREMAQIMDVPGRSGVRIDIANRPDQLLGCIAVGKVAVQDAIQESKLAYDQLLLKIHAALDAGNPVSIEIHAPNPPKEEQP